MNNQTTCILLSFHKMAVAGSVSVRPWDLRSSHGAARTNYPCLGRGEVGLLILGFGWRSEPTCDECYWVTCAEPSVKWARSADELGASEDISSNMHRLSGLLCTFSSYYRLANFTLRGTSMSPWIVLSTTGWAASFAGADMCLHMALSRSFDL